MKRINKIFLVIILGLLTQNCSTIKEGFSSQKKNSTDEFLVEKKSPLVMPPEYGSLPVPEIEDNEATGLEDDQNDIKKLFTNNDELNKDNTNTKEKKLNYDSILEKIKNN